MGFDKMRHVCYRFKEMLKIEQYSLLSLHMIYLSSFIFDFYGRKKPSPPFCCLKESKLLESHVTAQKFCLNVEP